jgi:hypothetical protein
MRGLVSSPLFTLTKDTLMSTELDLLKAQAAQMGISYKGNIGVDSLKARIKAKLEGTDTAEEPEEAEDAPQAKPLTKAQVEQATREKQNKEELKLIRVRIACLNPAKAQLQGEIITVANKYVGTVRKFIPFGEASDAGYHVPAILLRELKARQFNSVKTTKGDKGQIVVNQRLVPEFAIEELEPLTQEELDKLAATQMAAAGL